MTECEGIGRRRRGFDGYKGRGAHGIQDAMPQVADSLLQSSQVRPGAAKAPAPAPLAPQTIVAQPSGFGPQSVPQTPLRPAPTKGNVGNRAGTRSQRPRRSAPQSDAEIPRREAVLAQPGAPPGNSAPPMRPTSWSKFSDARWLTFTKFSGPALPQESKWASQARANSLLLYSQRWDTDADCRNDKASMGWVRHDACTVLRSQGPRRDRPAGPRHPAVVVPAAPSW